MKKSDPSKEKTEGQSPATTPENDFADASLEAQLETAMAERDAYHSRWLRAEADLDNYRKRAQKEAEESRMYRALPLLRDLLPGLDNLQRAVSAAANGGDSRDLVEGVKLVLKQFEGVLASHSIQAIDAVGQPFDPNLHAAVQQVPSPDHPPMTVVQELEKGYRLHDRVVRPSQVIVSSGPPAPAAGE